MRIYFKGLGSGELPALDVEDRRAVTLEDGKVCTACKHDSDIRVYAHEKWYTEPRCPDDYMGMAVYREHPIDVIREVDEWDYTLDNLRPSIRESLIEDARLLNMPVVIVFVRFYRTQFLHGINEYEKFTTLMAAGLIGLDEGGIILSWQNKGPFWPSVFERNIDALLEGNDWPEGMKRYGITPLGKIINPLPPFCPKCESRHFDQINQKCPTWRASFSTWADEHSL